MARQALDGGDRVKLKAAGQGPLRKESCEGLIDRRRIRSSGRGADARIPGP
jgi:hypothetical protein